MKKTALFALVSVMILSGHALADMASIKKSYVSGAFDGADDDWRRIIANRNRECGSYGDDRQLRRVDVLISRYEELGDAIDSGDDMAIGDAAKKFSDTVTMNGRFEACWDMIARKNGVRSSFKRQAAKM